jgi:hypothetical protein
MHASLTGKADMPKATQNDIKIPPGKLNGFLITPRKSFSNEFPTFPAKTPTKKTTSISNFSLELQLYLFPPKSRFPHQPQPYQ